jgi:hypothetical protein
MDKEPKSQVWWWAAFGVVIYLYVLYTLIDRWVFG